MLKNKQEILENLEKACGIQYKEDVTKHSSEDRMLCVMLELAKRLAAIERAIVRAGMPPQELPTNKDGIILPPSISRR